MSIDTHTSTSVQLPCSVILCSLCSCFSFPSHPQQAWSVVTRYRCHLRVSSLSLVTYRLWMIRANRRSKPQGSSQPAYVESLILRNLPYCQTCHIQPTAAHTMPTEAPPPPSNPNPAAITKADLLRRLQTGQIPGIDFLLVDLRRTDHEVLYPKMLPECQACTKVIGYRVARYAAL